MGVCECLPPAWGGPDFFFQAPLGEGGNTHPRSGSGIDRKEGGGWVVQAPGGWWVVAGGGWRLTGGPPPHPALFVLTPSRPGKIGILRGVEEEETETSSPGLVGVAGVLGVLGSGYWGYWSIDPVGGEVSQK